LSAWTHWAAVVAALGLAGCGAAATTPAATPAPAGGDPAQLVQLDAANFDALVLASSRPGVVEFHSPT
jgi:hypothetical protein